MAVEDYTKQGKEESKAIATRPVDLVNFGEGGAGDFDSGDVEIPYLAIVQGQGALARDKRFHVGDLVLMKEFVIPQPMRATVFGFTKFWSQNIEYEEGVFPTQFATTEDVLASGGNIEAGVKAGTDPNNFVRGAAIKVAIEVDGELAAVIPGVLEWEDSFIVRALWTVKGANFKSLIRRFNLIEGPLKQKGKTIAAKFGEFTVSEKKAGDFWVQRSEFKVLGSNSDEYLEFLRSIF